MSRLVLLDANALLLPFQFRINLDAELARLFGAPDIAVPTPVLRELEALAQRDRRARSALRLARAYPAIEAPGSADYALLDLALAREAAVVTNDAALRERLRAARVAVAYLRSRSHLVLDGA